MAKSFGIADTRNLDLTVLAFKRPEDAAGHLFFDNTHQVVRETPEAQQTIARLDLNYFIPCTVQGHNIAVLGLGKTAEGDFLSSEDVDTDNPEIRRTEDMASFLSQLYNREVTPDGTR